jgi:hypothetical protein
MTTTLFRILNLFALPGLAYGFVSIKEQLLSVADRVGDGALDLDSQLAGKIFTIAALFQGTLFLVSPFPQADLYGLKKMDHAKLQHSMEFIGASILACGIAPYFMLFQGTDVYEALANTMVFWTIFFFQYVVNGTQKKSGMKLDKLLVVAATALVAFYGCVTKAEWALTYSKACDVIYALNAIRGIFYAKESAEFWGVKAKDEEMALGLFLGKTFGFFHIQYRIQSFCLASGVDPPKAMAYGAFSGLTYFFTSFFVTKDIPKIAGRPAAYMYAFWLVFFSFMIYTILVGSGSISVAAGL